MKLITFALHHAEAKEEINYDLYRSMARVGVYRDDIKLVCDLNTAFNNEELTMKHFLQLGASGKQWAVDAMKDTNKNHHKVEDIILLAPIYQCEKIICIGMNYRDHCIEQNYPIPTEPVIFNKFPSAINEPFNSIEHFETDELDFEVELAVVIGKDGRNIKPEDALKHVAGYTVAHDVSARDWQLKKNGGQWLLGKTFDGYAPIGPYIVTHDEIGDPHKLNIKCTVNDEVVQDSNTSELIFKIEDLIAWCSRFFTLKIGDIIQTGTPPGVGVFRQPPLYLKPGDVVTCEIEKIGAIKNKIVKG